MRRELVLLHMPGYMLRNNQTGHPVMGDPFGVVAYVNQACELGINPHSHTWLPYLTPNGVTHLIMPLIDVKIQ